MTNYKPYINALRKCAKEHKNDITPFAHIRVSDLCQDTANLLEQLEQEPRWIPVSEKLPEKDGCYLVTEKSGRVCTYVFHKEGNSEEYWARCTVAWMPLPIVYSEVEE